MPFCLNYVAFSSSCLELWLKVHASAAHKLIPFMTDTVTVLKKATKLDDAYVVLEQARNILAAHKGEKDTEVQGMTVGLADIRVKQKKPEEALPMYLGVLKTLQESSSPQEVQLLRLLISLQESLNNAEAVGELKAQLKTASEKHGVAL